MKNIIFTGMLYGSIISSTSLLNLTQDVLDKIAVGKTDKSSLVHQYTFIYDHYFSAIKNNPITFLEIGFAGGGSAHMWDQYFTNSQTKLYFLDINQDCFKYTADLSKRCSLFMCDQENKGDLLSIIKKTNNQFDIIIDDGGHYMNQQIVSFETLFPYVKSGGVYIIEDLHTSYWKQYGGGGEPSNPHAISNSATEYFKKLVDAVNHIAAYTGISNRKLGQKIVTGEFTDYGKYNFNKNFFNELSYYQDHVLSIHFYSSMCFIFKK